ncbi:peptidase domain-containing ABC transporter [Oceanicoccus sagamiensis]|uniref:ABC transporter n=1 Tax=Oceanicoccus sagamiensis TaxID=716816 RepID=A0A1X9NB42_9GAMM|nr:ATP-binding cassette domain-containing protein [Oceanicoccus sagamiensis]ARN74371.1 hypothetical protein BST96_09700 [Oceanicoccus sagamiensis]
MSHAITDNDFFSRDFSGLLTATAEAPCPWRYALGNLLTALEWSGSLPELAAYLPEQGDPLDLTQCREILSKLGYSTKLKRGILAHIPDCDYPTLAITAPGTADETIVVLKSAGLDGIVVIDQAGNEQIENDINKPLQWLEMQPIPVKAAAPGQWFKELLQQFTGPLLGVLILSLFNALLGLVLPLFTMSVYDFLIPSGSISGLVAVGSGAILALGGLLVANRMRSQMLSRIAAGLSFQAGRSIFQKLIYSPADWLQRVSPVQHITRVRDVERVREFFGGTMAASLFDLPFIVVALIAIALLGGWLVAVPVIGAGIYALLSWHFNNSLAVASRNSAKFSQRRQQQLRQAIDGLEDLRESGTGSHWLKQFADESVRAARSNFSYTMVSASQQAVGRFLNMAIALATLMTGIFMVMTGALTTGGLIASMMLIWRVTGPLQTAFFSASRFKQLQQSISQMNAIMAAPYEQAHEQKLAQLVDFSPALEINNLFYRFSADRDAALSSVSFNCEAGQKVAVVGPNGSGKSTTLACVAGLLHPQSGSIRIDGHDIRQFKHVDYRSVIGYVSGSPDLISGTVRANFNAVAPMASEEAMLDALKQVGVADCFDSLDAVVLEEGNLIISDAVAEALSLARVLLRKPKVLILDDILSAAPKMIADSYRQLLTEPPAGTTIIYATHNNELMLMADIAVIMDKGAVAQVATLAEEPPES